MKGVAAPAGAGKRPSMEDPN